MGRVAARAFALIRLPARGLSRAVKLCVVEVRVFCGSSWLGCRAKSRGSPRKIRVSNRQKARVHSGARSPRKLCCFRSARVGQDDSDPERQRISVEVQPASTSAATPLQVRTMLLGSDTSRNPASVLTMALSAVVSCHSPPI